MSTLSQFSSLVLVAIALSAGLSEAQQTSRQPADSPLNPSPQLIPAPGLPGQFLLAAAATDGVLLLTPNEVFFPKPGLMNAGAAPALKPDPLNGGKSFSSIEKWDESDVAEWGLLLQHGSLNAELSCQIPAGTAKFTVSLAGQQHQVTINSTGTESEAPVSIEFQNVPAGQHVLKLKCDQAGRGVMFRRLQLSGAAVRNASLLRKRWRPAAAHTRFSASAATGKIRLWVMELDAVSGSPGFYCPVTTPFGYYGPTWLPDGRVNSGFNFSLWSYGRGKAEPPVERLSHLVAIGNPDASFGQFGHEGTGVKIRNWEPLAGRQTQRQAIALRVESGANYDTYSSYFYAADSECWRLFGVGKKHHGGKPLKSLWVGSFVEVPGPPQIQRTGPYPRRMRYRGWVMQEDGQWFRLDRMTNGNIDRQTGLTHTHRGVTDDGWFFLQTGGWTFRTPDPSDQIQLPRATAEPRPAFMNPEKLQTLLQLPTTAGTPSVTRRAQQVDGQYTLSNAGSTAQATLFWGSEEALTFRERWQHSLPLPAPKEGINRFTIPAVPQDQPLFLRIFVKTATGQFWSDETTILNVSQ